MALIGYARVSSFDQNLDLQLNALRQARCDRIFTDKISGLCDDRPGLRDALNTLQRGDVFCSWRLDRVSRSLSHLVSTVTHLRERGVEFRSLTESIATDSPGGKLVFHLFCALAEFEADLIRARTKAGLVAARAAGRIGGRPMKLTGDQASSLKVLHMDGKMSVAEMAATLGISRTTLYGYLK